jgi:pimeloyl-ACP methyl ester carboxylesterase
MKFWRILLALVIVLLAALLVGPFLVPVPPLEGLVPPRQLADPDSRFIQVNGIEVHYKIAGSGEPALILLHGFGASEFTWRETAAPLAELGAVIRYDRPAFGLTERPLEWSGPNPYSTDFQVDLVIGLMDALGVPRAVLVGNSAGGTVAMLAALRYPERVQGLILASPAVYAGGGSPAYTRWLFQTPQMDRLGPLVARNIQNWGRDFAASAWHDPSRITAEIWAGYTRPLQAENWDRALWNLTRASRPSGLDQRLAELDLPILVITGDDDRIVPTEQSIRLAGELPAADLVVIPSCGHVPQEECPQPFLQASREFLARLGQP